MDVVASELARERGIDGKTYVVTPTCWTQELLEQVWRRRAHFRVLSDDVEHTFGGFHRYVLESGGQWFSVICVEDRQLVGMMYLTDMSSSMTENRFLSAMWHCELWDSKAGTRINVLRAAIRTLFATLGLHRMSCEIPTKFGGAIRIAKKIGFVPDGRHREARRYDGEWYDVLSMSLLEQEVSQWAL